jgi:hypothetical protein
MTNRKILYGYRIQNGDLSRVEQEAVVVSRVFTLYAGGLSYQKISDILNGDHIPFSPETPQWNKHKVKRMLENPRYIGADGYPPIVERDDFDTIQSMIQEKTSHCAKAKERPALRLKKYLRCGNCGGRLLGTGRHGQRRNSLYLRCERCDMPVTIPDDDLLNEVSRQMAEHNKPAAETYSPSADTIRLTNAINRGLERPVKPEETVSMILQGITARYNCCPTPTESESINRPTEVNFRSFGQAVSHITIPDENVIGLHFH